MTPSHDALVAEVLDAYLAAARNGSAKPFFGHWPQ